ncbi:MAG: hypothetical protein NT175_01130 [Bacteroidetes bacterium]|nr:hypothetical protein [Bacteroidota bacterium]
MYNQNDTSAIQCKIHQDSFTAMNVIKQKINHGASVCIKAKYAEELSDKVACLIDCPQYDDQKQDCKYCRMIAHLHKKTAELIIKAKCLSQ